MLSRRSAGWAAGAMLLLAAACSPGLLASYFSPDGVLSEFVAARLLWLRWFAFAGAGGLALFALAGGKLRLESWRKPFEKALPWVAGLAGLWMLSTELRVYESDSISEGIVAYGALRTTWGDVPCRDFFTFVFPGAFYLLGWLYGLLGSSLDAARWASSIIPKLLCAILLYRVARRCFGLWASLGVGALTLLTLSHNPDNAQIYNGNWSLLGAFGSLALLDLVAAGAGWRAAAGAGACVAFALAMRQDMGVYALAGGGSWLLLRLALRRKGWTDLIAYAAGFGVPAAALAAWMFAVVPVEDLRQCYLGGAAAYMKHVSALGRALLPLGMPWSEAAGYSLPQLATKALLYQWVWWVTMPALVLGLWVRNGLRMGLPLLFSLFFLAHAYKGSANSYSGSLPAAALVWAWGLTALGGWGARLLLAYLLAIGGMRLLFRPFAPPSDSGWARTAAGPHRVATAQEASDLERTIALLRERVGDGRLLVLDEREAANDTLIYFLSGLRHGGRYHEHAIGIAKQERVIRELTAELDAKVYARVLTTGAGALSKNPSTPVQKSLVARYEPEAEFGRYHVWRPRGIR